MALKVSNKNRKKHVAEIIEKEMPICNVFRSSEFKKEFVMPENIILKYVIKDTPKEQIFNYKYIFYMIILLSISAMVFL